MSWKIIIHFRSGGTHEVGHVETPKIATEKIHKIFEAGLTIKSETKYAYYPPEGLIMRETMKTE